MPLVQGIMKVYRVIQAKFEGEKLSYVEKAQGTHPLYETLGYCNTVCFQEAHTHTHTQTHFNLAIVLLQSIIHNYKHKK